MRGFEIESAMCCYQLSITWIFIHTTIFLEHQSACSFLNWVISRTSYSVLCEYLHPTTFSSQQTYKTFDFWKLILVILFILIALTLWQLIFHIILKADIWYSRANVSLWSDKTKNIMYKYSPSNRSLSSRRASRLSRRSCRSISWLMRFCSFASSDRQHSMVSIFFCFALSPPITNYSISSELFSTVMHAKNDWTWFVFRSTLLFLSLVSKSNLNNYHYEDIERKLFLFFFYLRFSLIC